MIGISQTIVEILNLYQQYSIFKQDEAHYNFSREKGNFSGENGRPEKFTVGILGNVREIGVFLWTNFLFEVEFSLEV